MLKQQEVGCMLKLRLFSLKRRAFTLSPEIQAYSYSPKQDASPSEAIISAT